MLIFGRGLRIRFWNVTKTAILEGKIKFKIPTQVAENAYEVDVAFRTGDCVVHDDQITQVHLRDANDNDIWVHIDDLYASFPNDKDKFIGTSTRYPNTIFPKVRLSPITSNSLNYMIRDEEVTKLTMLEWKLTPKKVIFNGPATVVMWQDGTKTVVKKTEDDTDDREKAVMFAILKKACGSRAKMNRYLKLFKEDKSNEEKKEEAGSSELHWKKQRTGSDSSESTV